MLQYFIILLDTTSVPFCHVNSTIQDASLISLDILKKSIIWGMKRDLKIQFVYPNYDIPQAHEDIIQNVAHIKIKPSSNRNNADIIVCNQLEDLQDLNNKTVIFRTTKDILFANTAYIAEVATTCKRFNLCLTDIENFAKEDFKLYEKALNIIATELIDNILDNKIPQFNLLTDRIFLNKMNNCGAGVESITLAPNGSFYICPAFYYINPMSSCGEIDTGYSVKNPQLLHIDHAPICRICDAYQCHRCLWLNYTMTLDINTPSYEQCVTAHIERNISREILNTLHSKNKFTEKEISKINHTDPFDLIFKNK